MKLATTEACAVLSASIQGTLPAELALSIDTRTLQTGQTYLALVGERFDGHAFLTAAHHAGAAAAIVSNPTALPPELPGIVVADTHNALLSLAALSRRHFCGAVIALTGSAGKTTTKAFLAHILEAAQIGPIAATPLNENNEIGVSKVLLGLTCEAAAVIEMGARQPDDIAPLVSIARPHIAILTNVGDAHVGIFGSRAELARTKWQIFANGGQPILSLADAVSRERYTSLSQAPLFCGLASDPPIADVATLRLAGHTLQWHPRNTPSQEAVLTDLPPGEHNQRNLLSACSAALLLGIPLTTVARAASSVSLPNGRYERISAPGGITIIHDAYNASPSGSVASLQAFAQEAGRRIVLFGGMAELGEEAVAAHRRVGAALAPVHAAKILLSGELAHEVAEGARAAGVLAETIVQTPDNATSIATLQAFVQPGDIILIKGSRRYALEEIVHALRPAQAGVPARQAA